jgi:hypothetical protein
VHVAPWPTVGELPTLDVPAPGSVYGPICEVLEAIRREKSTAKVSQRAVVSRCAISAPAHFLTAVRSGEVDLLAAGGVVELTTSETTKDVTVVVTLETS